MRRYPTGGFPQVFPSPVIGGISINASPLIQAASMPIDSGLQGYLGLQQIRERRERQKLQKEQMALQKEEFRMRMDQAQKQDTINTFKLLSSVRDDILNIELLPADMAEYQRIANEEYGVQDAANQAQSGDGNAVKKLTGSATGLMMDPRTLTMIQNKRQSDSNLANFSKLMQDDLTATYITNMPEIMESVYSGKGTPKPEVDWEGLNEERKAIRDLMALEKETRIVQAKAQADKLRQEATLDWLFGPEDMKSKIEERKSLIESREVEQELKQVNIEQARALLDRYREAKASNDTDTADRILGVLTGRSSSTKRTPEDVKVEIYDALVAANMDPREAMQQAFFKQDDVQSSGYKDLSKYTSPVTIGTVTLNPTQIKQSFGDKVPSDKITPAGGWLLSPNNWTPSTAGDKSYAYTQDGYLYTNNPWGLIKSGITTEDKFKNDVENFGEGVWRIPVSEPTPEVATKSGVSLEGLDPYVKGVINEINSTDAFKGIVITSATRTPEGNKGVGGDPDSAHLSGNGFDIRTKLSMEGGAKGHAFAKWLQTDLGKQWLSESKLKAIWEDQGGENEHLHIEKIQSTQPPTFTPPPFVTTNK